MGQIAVCMGFILWAHFFWRPFLIFPRLSTMETRGWSVIYWITSEPVGSVSGLGGSALISIVSKASIDPEPCCPDWFWPEISYCAFAFDELDYFWIASCSCSLWLLWELPHMLLQMRFLPMDLEQCVGWIVWCWSWWCNYLLHWSVYRDWLLRFLLRRLDCMEIPSCCERSIVRE